VFDSGYAGLSYSQTTDFTLASTFTAVSRGAGLALFTLISIIPKERYQIVRDILLLNYSSERLPAIFGYFDQPRSVFGSM
jgi:hypothetical protein